jgi:hypothetical protein
VEFVVANELTVVPAHLDDFSAVSDAAAATIEAAGSADSSALLAAVAAALGPIGAGYLSAYAPAQASNLAGTLLVSAVHAGVKAATDSSKSSFVATDQYS